MKDINNSTIPSADRNSFPNLKFCSHVLMSSNLTFNTKKCEKQFRRNYNHCESEITLELNRNY